MKEIKYTKEHIQNASYNSISEIGKDEMMTRFPHLENRDNAKVIKIAFPVGVKSSDEGVKRILDANSAKIKAESMKDMPIHFADDESGLPDSHDDGDNDNKPEVGHILASEMIGDEIVVHALLHPKTQKRATELIQANKKLLGCSWEIMPKMGVLDEAGETETITDWDWAGLAILDKKAAAYKDSRIMVANKKGKGVMEMAEEKEIQIVKVVDETVAKELADSKAKLAEIEKAEADKTRQAELDKITVEANAKIKELEEKVKLAESDKEAIKKQIEEENAKKTEAEKLAQEKARQEVLAKRQEELKDFIASTTDEDKKKIILSTLEKLDDGEYEIFKIGKTKEKAQSKDLFTSMGNAVNIFATKDVKDVSVDELKNIFGEKWVK